MNIIDLVIIIFLLFGASLGFKRGFTRQLVSSVGFIIIVILAFNLRSPISEFLFRTLPFFNFGGLIKGVSVLNILLYEFIAFLVVLLGLSLILKILMFATKLFEGILNMTIVLGIPSKILGAVVGVIEYYVIAFIFLYVISLPFFNISFASESKYKDKILQNTPILSSFVDKTVAIVGDFNNLKEKFKTEKDPNQFNLEALDVLLSKKIVSLNTVDDLIERNKLQIDNVEIILQKYR